MQKLSAELFEQITRTLISDRSLRIHEKRIKPRVGLRSALDVISCDDRGQRPASSVWVRDVSADGLGLISAEPLETDLPFIAEFNRANNSPLQILYKVAHCRKLASGIYSIGACLVKVMSARRRATD